MELTYVKEFAVIAETKHYAEAAEKMFISPSSLTRHIQAMEKEFGKPLFIRTCRNVELTDFGKAFLPYAKKIVYPFDEFCANNLINVRRDRKVIVGCTGGIAPHNAGFFISRFRMDNPDIDLEYLQVPLESQLKMLHENMYDFLITGEESVSGTEFNSVVCGEDYYVLAVPASHRLVGRSSITLPELTGEKFAIVSSLAYEGGDFIFRCRNAGLAPDFTVVDANNAIDYAVIGGQPVVMSRQSAEFFAESGIFIVKIEPELRKKMMLVYRKSPELSFKEKRFLEYIYMSASQSPIME